MMVLKSILILSLCVVSGSLRAEAPAQAPADPNQAQAPAQPQQAAVPAEGQKTEAPTEAKKQAKKEGEAERKPASEKDKKKKKNKNEPYSNFEDEFAYIDSLDAMTNRRFLHRIILKEAIESSAKFTLGRFYVNHFLGFSVVHQNGSGDITDTSSNWTEFTSGTMGFGLGYSSEAGHAAEIGLDFSAVTNIHLGYRYILPLESFGLWPYGGLGVGYELSFLRLDNGPEEARIYDGQRAQVYGVLGALLPLLDVGLKFEVRFSYYGPQRLVAAAGFGAVLLFDEFPF